MPRTEWNRASLWATHDARQSHDQRLRAHVLAVSIIVLWSGVAVLTYSCHELYLEDDTTHVHVKVPAAPAECVVDADCAVLPERATCCGTCEPVPPFEAVTRTVLEDYLGEVATGCASSTACEPLVCVGRPAGCEVRPVCSAGTCRVETTAACANR